MTQLLQIYEPGATPQPHQKEEIAVGIDLGTTNSLVAVAQSGTAEILRGGNGEALLPSLVSYSTDSILVGEDARRVLLDAPEQVITSVKRLMGRGAEDLLRISGQVPYEVETPVGPESGMVRLRVTGRSLTPVEVSAELLRAIRARAESALGHRVTRAVITVPAHFDDAARTATRDAATLAGLETLRLVNEPTAAALAYGLDQEAEGLYAVYDLGGGTFDVSILRMRMGVFQVLATGGDSLLGGDDFDRAIAEYFIQERTERLGETELTPAEVKLAMVSGRLAKESLTSQERGTWSINVNGTESEHSLDRDRLESLIAPMVNRTLTITNGVLRDAGILPEDIQGLILVGGSTRVPLVRRRAAELFGREPLVSIDPEEVVALGAALQAEALTHGSEVLLLDVTPLSLGIETMGGLVEKVIPRNTPVPVVRSQEFTTYQDGQGAMSIHVLQGERELVAENRSLARFVLDGIPGMAAGAARIRVTFAVDADGLLTVRAEETTTSMRQQVSVKPSYGLTEEEMGVMLQDSLEHAQGDMEERLLREVKVDGERILQAISAALAADGDLLSQSERDSINAGVDALRLRLSSSDNRSVILLAIEACNAATEDFAARRMDRGIRSVLEGRSLGEVVDHLTDEN